MKGDMTDAAAFSFSTQGDTIGFMLELQWTSDKFTATMMAAVVRPSTRSDPLYHKKLRGQIAPKPRFVKLVDLRGH